MISEEPVGMRRSCFCCHSLSVFGGCQFSSLCCISFSSLPANFAIGILRCVLDDRITRLYAFDVHCNSFFPMFIMLYVIQYFVSPILVAHGFFSVLLSNLLFVVAISYYHYLSFIGYDVLLFLDKTTFFLYPIGLVIMLSPLFLVLVAILSGFNPTRYVMSLYFS